MKKIGLGLVALVLVAVIYYFTIGASQITEEIKAQVNTQLTSLEKEGFGIEERKAEEEKEHFVISFDDPKKISSFLYRQGMQLTVEDAELLKGLKVGVDTHYLPDAYSSVAFDIYPSTLPEIFTSSSNADDKLVLAEIQKMLDKKTFLMHLAINKTASGFKGNLADINETIKDVETVNLHLKGLTFNGDIQENAIHSFKQTLENFSVFVSDELKVSFSDIKSDYKITGNTLYDYTTHYTIANILVDMKAELNVTIQDIDVLSNSTVTNDIASGTIKTTVAHTNVTDGVQPYDLENFIFKMKASNIDITAMDKMQKADLSDEKVMNELLTQLFSKGVEFEISTLSLESIENDGQKIDGFELGAQVTFHKDFDVLALEKNPLSALNTVDADLKLEFSKEFFELMAQQPPVMMALMMFPPKDENDKKQYTLELKNGKVTINGKPVM